MRLSQVCADERRLMAKWGAEQITQIHRIGISPLLDYNITLGAPLVAIVDIRQTIIGKDLCQNILINERISGIEELDILAGGLIQPFVHRFIDAAIRLAYAPRNIRCISADDVLASVRGPTINYEPFEIIERLPGDAFCRS